MLIVSVASINKLLLLHLKHFHQTLSFTFAITSAVVLSHKNLSAPSAILNEVVAFAFAGVTVKGLEFTKQEPTVDDNL
jgi:hypothetical protein